MFCHIVTLLLLFDASYSLRFVLFDRRESEVLRGNLLGDQLRVQLGFPEMTKFHSVKAKNLPLSTTPVFQFGLLASLTSSEYGRGGGRCFLAQ